MRTIRKFFDADGTLVDESKAATCHELTINDAGRVVGDVIYQTKQAAKTITIVHTKEAQGEWRTINGRHVFIGEGQTASEALEQSLHGEVTSGLKEGDEKKVKAARDTLDALSIAKLNVAFKRAKDTGRLAGDAADKTEKAVASVIKRRAEMDSRLKAMEERIAKLRKSLSDDAAELVKEINALAADWRALEQQLGERKSMLLQIVKRKTVKQEQVKHHHAPVIEEKSEQRIEDDSRNITVKRFTAQEELAPDAVISKRDVKDASGEVVDYRDVRIRGYLTTWQETTPKDREGEYVVKGAFNKGLSAFMQNPVMLRDHKNSTDSVAGSFKVMKEDGRGLYFEALLSNSDQMKSVRRDIVDGHLKTTSMGGAFVYDRDKKGIREVALYEGTLTPIPMNPDARFEVLDASPIEKKFIADGGSLAGMKSVGKLEAFRQSLTIQLKA
jgi:HK97 family phage prohead protease